MRATTIKQAAQYFKEQDANTPITETGLRRLVKNGDIRSCKVGTKFVVTIEAIEEYFSGGNTGSTSNPTKEDTGIRPLPSRFM